MHWSYMKQPEQNHKTVTCGQGKEFRWESGRRIRLVSTEWSNHKDAVECLMKFGFFPDG